MSDRIARLFHLTKRVVRRVSGVDAARVSASTHHLQFRLDVLGERLERIDRRLLGLEDQMGVGLPIEQQLPPTPLMELVGGAGSFDGAGRVMAGHLKDFAELTSSDAVLDVGCGCGRTARHLLGTLSAPGRYSGFDIVQESVRWCQTYLSRANPSFEFVHANIYNGLYNPVGTMASSDYRFPWPDDTFDLAFLDSVFTHMFPADVGHYLDELRRVLKPGGRVLASFFVLDETSRAAMRATGSHLQFVHPGDGWFTVSPEVPESAIGYEAESVARFFDVRGFDVRKKRFGDWSGRTGADVGAHQQDLVLAFKSP